MRKLSTLERWGAVTLVIVGAAYAYLELLREPQGTAYADLVKKNNGLVKSIESLKEQPQSPQGIEKSASKLRGELAELREKLEALRAELLTPSAMLEETVMRISESAANNGLRVAELSPLENEKFSLFSPLESEQKLLERSLYRMKLSGGLLSFYDFLSELSNMPAIITVSHITITSNEEHGNIDVDLVLFI
ncbi:MAG: type 4a pilus biogenesis protein PilO [Oceanidesulfovibrio sp.]